MRVYRQTTQKEGETITVKKWYGDVRLAGGKRCRLPLFESEKESRKFADRLDVVIGEHEGGGGYSRETQGWINQLNPDITKRLANMGLLDTARAASLSSIGTHLDDWREALIHKGTTQKQADQNHHRAKRIFTEAGFHSLNDINPQKTIQAIGQLKTSVHRRNHKTDKIELEKTGPASSFTRLHHLRAVKQFTKWALINGRLTQDPLIHSTVNNVRVENQRRALSVAEISYLLAYVETAPASWNIPGPERALIYELAVNTGLRRDEIKSLKRNNFDFKRLSVKVDAQDTKNKRPALLPVKAAMMGKIKQHLSNKLPTATAFNIPDAAAKMLRKDMNRARQEWIDAAADNADEHLSRTDSDFLKVETTHQGKVDFHSLRHTFGTLLAESGVHPKVAMDLMRHSDINLTMALYTHSNQEQATAAIDAMPSFGKVQKRRKKA
jgi:integrase